MARQNHRQRSGLRDDPWFEPSFGVVHRVQFTEEIEHYFNDLESSIDEIDPIRIYDSNGNVTAEKPVVRLFNPRRLSLRIVERRLTQGYGKNNKYQWNPRDKARIQQEVVDEIGRYGLGGRVINAKLHEVHRLGDADAALTGGRILSLSPDSASLEAEFFATEHDIAVNGISKSLQRFRTTAPYLPHVSFGRMHQDATPKQVTDVIVAVQHHLPLDTVLSPIEFTAGPK